MAFKITPPYSMDNTPIYNVSMEDGVMGKANNNGSIILNKDLDPEQCEKVIAHEKVHVKQFKNGDLDYDDNNIYWKGKVYSRSKINEGNKNLPWESPAYKVSGHV